MDVTQKMNDEVIDHLTDVRKFEESIQIGNSRIVNRHRESLVKLVKEDLATTTIDQKKKIANKFRREQNRFATELFSWQKTNLTELHGAEVDFYTDSISKHTKGWFSVRRPKNKADLADITGASINGDAAIKNNVENIARGETTRVQTWLKRGRRDNKSQNQIISDVSRTTKMTAHQAGTLSRTGITATQRDALFSAVGENKEVIKGYMFQAMLDNRTSSICRYHDGKIYDVGDRRFAPPLHFNCRSTLVPIFESKAELLKKESDRINLAALETTKGSSLTGSPPEKETFGQWLKRQAYDVQTKILGSQEKADLFRKGEVKADNFVTPQGSALSITALRRRAANLTNIFRPKQSIGEDVVTQIAVARPSTLVRNAKYKREVVDLFVNDADDLGKTYSLTDFKGTTLQGKQTARRRTANIFDESNNSFDPLTGEARNNNLYDPNYTLLQERLDFMRNSKVLQSEDKDFIGSVINSLEEKVSTNQQTVAIENLRVVIERARKDKQPWDNFANVLRAENRFAVQNTARLLDTRQRDKYNLFSRFFGAKEGGPQVQLMGDYYKIDQLQDRLLADQRSIDSFRTGVGAKLSKELYFRGKSPPRSYFQGLLGKVKKPETLKKRWEKTSFAKYLKWYRTPTDELAVRFERGIDERIRRIIDFEFLTSKKNPTSKVMDDKVLNSLSKAVKLVGSGQMTDYDGLAIAIGKQMAKDLEDVNPFQKHTLQDYHKDGSRVLDYMKDRKMIRLNYRGKTRRGVLDVETGRATGFWGDTVSREIEVIDKRLIELQKAERRVVVGRRMGISFDRDRQFVRAGKKEAFDARGNVTGRPIISRRKYASFDANQVDADFANALNQASGTQYQTDPVFFNFMDDVVRFRDPRGNTDYYDGLNEFRHEIIKRGDQGFGFMTAGRYQTNRGKPFWSDTYMDSRGRIYHRGYLTPTGGEMVRPFLDDAIATPMTLNAVDELETQIGAMIGPGTEALTLSGRKAIFQRKREDILSLGRLMQQETQRDRRMREFLEHPLIKGLEGPEVPKMSRMALEYARVYDHVGGDMRDAAKLKLFKTRLMIENDASSSGAQIIGLSTRDRMVSEASNVVPTTQKNRLYDLVAIDTINDPRFNKIKALRDANLTWEDLAKGAKAQNINLYCVL